jgi:hypothetical protein
MNFKMLIRSLDKLIVLFEQFENACKKSYEISAFSDASKMAREISSMIEGGDYDSALQKWQVLEYYCNDSLPHPEGFLSKYMPIRQSIINFGLHR